VNLQLSNVLHSKQAFEFWAEVYDDSPNPIVHRSERAIIDRLPDLHGLAVADLACGTGRLLPRIYRLSPQTCVGVDLSYAMLQKARMKEKVAGRLIQADLHELPILSGSLDLVTFSLGLSYFPNLVQVALEIQRILKPGGSVLCTDFHTKASDLGWKRSFKIRTNHYVVFHYHHIVENVLLAFSQYFQFLSTSDLFFGEAERAIFEYAGKSSLFENFSSQPALILFEWRKPSGNVCTGSIMSSVSSC
jgi:malonyl-CoA O-methyltransferase